VAPAGALPVGAAIVDKLAHLPTRLSDLGNVESKQLINWGYAICDRCVRTLCRNGPILMLNWDKRAPRWTRTIRPASGPKILFHARRVRGRLK
jgi:hypothetical protein